LNLCLVQVALNFEEVLDLTVSSSFIKLFIFG